MISNGKMTDRELLERAAKAAGLEPELLQWDEERECVKYQFRSDVTEGHLWNPLTHEGDAFRLMVKLGIDVCFGSDKAGKTICVLVNSEPHYGDDVDALCAAAQRAIVELAAADY
jgi:hypothetical protein